MIKLSDKETDNLLRREKEAALSKRKAEVREQSKVLSKRIVTSRQLYRKTLLDKVEDQLLACHQDVKEAGMKQLKVKIQESVEAIGTAHKAADLEPDYEAIRAAQTEVFRKFAKVRVKYAAKVEEDIRTTTEAERLRIPTIRREVRSLEDLRAAHLVRKFKETVKDQGHFSRPVSPKPDPVIVFDQKNFHQFKTYRLKNLVSKSTVDRNAREMAEQAAESFEEERRLIEKEKIKRKADERGRKALRAEAIKRQYLGMVERLQGMELEPGWEVLPEELQSLQLAESECITDSRSNRRIVEEQMAEKSKNKQQYIVTKAAKQIGKTMERHAGFDTLDVGVQYELLEEDVQVFDSEREEVVSPDFTRPLLDDFQPRKKLFDQRYLNEAKNLLDELANKRKDLEKEFVGVPREVKSSFRSTTEFRGSSYRVEVDTEREERLPSKSDKLLDEGDISRLEKILELKKDFRGQDAFEKAQDSFARKTQYQKGTDEPSFEVSDNSTGNTSYMDLPRNKPRGIIRKPDFSGSGSTDYLSLPDKISTSVPKLKESPGANRQELTDLVKRVIAGRR